MNGKDFPDFHAMETEILKVWRDGNIFEKSLALHAEEHVFYDGPPFPTGSPHYGTIFVSVVKDCIARYFTMAGKSVPRAWGWDCHGLPIETAVEKKLGITNKKQIVELGAEKFNAECRNLVMDYHDSWREYIEKVGRWVDYEHPYRTLDRDYMESVIWAFKECWNGGLIYKDYRVAPYCYRCETTLSISDTRDSGATRPKVDTSVVVRLRVTDDQAFPARGSDGDELYLLAWTTTPWTLPGNVALGVGRELQYVLVRSPDGLYILAADLLEVWRDKLELGAPIMLEISGQELIGLHYEPLVRADTGSERSYQVVAADFVNFTVALNRSISEVIEK